MALQKRLPPLIGAGTPVAPRRENEFAHAEKDMTTYGNRVGILTSSSNILLSVPFAQFSGADDRFQSTSGIAEATPDWERQREGARSCQRPSLSIQNIGASAQKRRATLRTK
jgi:hypothetical protein